MKFVSPKEFSEFGFLHELNRTWLHPLGMELEADPDGGVFRIQDYRDDPEGMIFRPERLSREKHDRVEAFRKFRREARMAALGYIKQPIPHQKKKR